MNADHLKTLIDAADNAGIVEFFSRASEADRKTVAGMAVQRFKHEAKTPILRTEPESYRWNPCLGSATLAVLASCSFSQIKQLGAKARNGGKEVCDVLTARRPDWLEQWLELMIEVQPNIWPTIRELMRRTGCRRPDHDNYILGMIYGILDRNSFRGFDRKKTLAEALLEDPDLLDFEVWRLFEIEGGGEHSLAARDKFSNDERSWGQTLAKFAREGRLSRERLIDASLDALNRGFAQFRAGWFARFHDLLEPTADEEQVRTDRYLGLMASSIPTTVSWALKIVENLDKKRALPTAALLDALRPVLDARAKGTVSAAIKFLARIAKRDPASSAAVCLAATVALAHESAEVQNAAINMIEKFGSGSDPQLFEGIAHYGGAVSPSVRPRLDKIVEKTEKFVANRPTKKVASRKPAPDLSKRIAGLPQGLARLAGVPQAQMAAESGEDEIAALSFDGTEFPRLDAAARLAPVASVDELIDLAAKVIEGAGSINDAERVLDGVSRLCDQRPADFAKMTGPLAKRIRDLSQRSGGPFVGLGPVEDILGVLRAWLDRKVVEPTSRKHSSTGCEFFVYDVEGKERNFYVHAAADAVKSLSLRTLEVARRAAESMAQPLLSAPTHAGGWIDPRALVERATEMTRRKIEPSTLEIVFALLRLAPDHRNEALAMAESLQAEHGAAIRYALGGKAEKTGPTAALWVAAARARSPWTNDDRVEKAHPELGPDAGTAASYEIRMHTRDKCHFLRIQRQPKEPKLPDPLLPTVRFHVDRGSEITYGQIGGGAIRWLQTIWPIAMESFFAQGAESIAANLDWWEAQWGNRGYFELLLDADVPMRPMALLLLTLGLAAKEPGEQGLATEALIAAIRDGRLDGPKFGGTMAQLWPAGLIKMARWAKALSDAARVSPLHAQVIFVAIERALQGDAKKLPHDAHTFLDLFKELGVEMGARVQSESTRKLLSDIKGSSKTGKLATALLSLDNVPDRERQVAVTQIVLDQRLFRAERWTARRAADRT